MMNAHHASSLLSSKLTCVSTIIRFILLGAGVLNELDAHVFGSSLSYDDDPNVRSHQCIHIEPRANVVVSFTVCSPYSVLVSSTESLFTVPSGALRIVDVPFLTLLVSALDAMAMS
jgi:hypothetical protein